MPTFRTSNPHASESHDESARAYCTRLAQQIRTYERKEADTPEKREAFGATWRAAFRRGAFPFAGASEAQMVEALLPDPRA